MKHLGENRFVRWRLIASVLLAALPVTALAQGLPNILWRAGGHGDSINSVAYSPDGQLLVSGSSDRTIKIWRKYSTFSHPDGFSFIRTLSVPYDIDAQLTDVLSVAISPDGTLVAAGLELYNGHAQSEFGGVKIWRISDGVLVQSFTGYGAAVRSVAFSPGGKYLATGSKDHSVKIWRMGNGALVSSRFDHTQAVNAVAFSRDGRWLASGADDHTAKLYRTSDWGVERTFTGHTDNIYSVAFSPDSTRLATGSWDQTVRLWNVPDGSLIFPLIHGSGIATIAFSPDGLTLASGAWDHNIKLWDPNRGTLIDTLVGHSALVNTVVFAPDNHALVSGSWYPEFAIKLWSLSPNRLVQTVTNHSSSINALIFTTNSQLISGGDSTARFWDAVNGRFLKTINPATNVGALALSPDGQLIAMPGSNHTVKIYRTSDGMLVQTLIGHTDDVTGVAFSHDGTLFASGAFFNGSNDAIKLWNVSNWSLARELTGQFIFGPFDVINFSPNDVFLTATCEGTPALWRVSDGAFIRSFPCCGFTTFSPNGALLAVGTNPVRVYRTSDWMQVASLSDQNQALAFTPDGLYLATVGSSQLQFWRVSDWTLQLFYDQELNPNGFGVTSIAFSPDGARFAYGRYDAAILVAINPFAPSPLSPRSR